MTPTTSPMSNPETTGVILLYRGGEQVGQVLATDVVINENGIWFTEVRRVEVRPGHTEPRMRARHNYRPNGRHTQRFVSITEYPHLAREFGDLYGWEYAKSECE